MTDSWSIKEQGRVFFDQIPINFLSILSNFFIILLCFNSQELKAQRHTKYLIANTAFLNVCFATSLVLRAAVYSTFYVFDIEISAIGCTFFDTAMLYFGIAAILSYFSTILSRYRKVKLHKDCSRQLVFGLLLYPYIAIVPYLFKNWILADSLRSSVIQKFCKVLTSSEFEAPFSRLLMTWVMTSYLAQMLLSLRLYQHIKSHFKRTTGARRELERLKAEKSILQAVLIQGVAPVILAAPTIVGIILFFLVDLDLYKPLFYGLKMNDLLYMINCLNPLVDAWAVLYVMIPYATARRKFFERMRSKTSVTVVVSSVQ